MARTINPIHQFQLTDVVNIEFFGKNFNLTNGSIVMLVTLFIALMFWFFLKEKKGFLPSRLQTAIELTLLTIRNTVSNSLGENGSRHVPFVFSVFLFILLLNLIGLIPGTFAQTSHISITFALAMLVFFTCVGISVVKRGFGFFKIFVPSGTPWWLLPLMFMLEFFSYLVRPVSLSIRLAANMIAGHVMLDVIAFFVIMMGIFGILPFAFLSVLMLFELFVAFLQAYIFSIFACVYINEACSSNH